MRRKLRKSRGQKEEATGDPGRRDAETIDLDELGLDQARQRQPVDGDGQASAFESLLQEELESPSVEEASIPAPSVPSGPPAEPIRSAMDDRSLREEIIGSHPAAEAEHDQVTVDALFHQPASRQHPVEGRPSTDAGPGLSLGFWDHYDQSISAAELFAVPPAAITAVVGSLGVAASVAQRCRASHWVSDCEVYVLTERPEAVTEPDWQTLRRPSDVIAVLDGRTDFPLIVVDVPRELPAWVRPLMTRVREAGVGLVRYVLDDDPSDEDLATWHGELGRPSVLDLSAPIPPTRVLELLDRGEPVASVGGMAITADLLLAMRVAG